MLTPSNLVCKYVTVLVSISNINIIIFFTQYHWQAHVKHSFTWYVFTFSRLPIPSSHIPSSSYSLNILYPHLLDISVCSFPHVIILHYTFQWFPRQLDNAKERMRTIQINTVKDFGPIWCPTEHSQSFKLLK